MRIPLLGVALACLAFPLAPLAAQNDGPSNRGRLGIFLNEESDSGGARVRGVVPQGPAAKAGIERGDLIVRFNGTAVSGSQKLVTFPGASSRAIRSSSSTVAAAKPTPRPSWPTGPGPSLR